MIFWIRNMLVVGVLNQRAGIDCLYLSRGEQLQNKNRPSLSGQRQPAAVLRNLFALEHKFLELVSYFCHVCSSFSIHDLYFNWKLFSACC